MKKIYAVWICTEWNYADDGPVIHDIVGFYPTEELAIVSIIRRIEHYKMEALKDEDEDYRYNARLFSYDASEIKPGLMNRIDITCIGPKCVVEKYIYYTEETLIENLSEENYLEEEK